MIWILFCAFVGVVGIGFLVSGIFAHTTHLRTAAGWWAGVIISITLFILAQPLFESLPQKVFAATEQSACGAYYTTQVKQTDWDTVASEAVQVNIPLVFVGFVLCLLGIEVLKNWIDIPEKFLAFVFLALACMSLSVLLYVFLIRKFSYFIFSAVLGMIIGIPIHIAFFSELEKLKKHIK
jgi:hypothetical protein